MWKTKLIDTFGNRGWYNTKRAVEFRYIGGKLSEYAIKKQKLLVDDEKSIPDIMIIKLIVAGLPNYLLEKLDKNKIKSTDNLIFELMRLENDVNIFKRTKDREIKSTYQKNEKRFIANYRKKKIEPCQYCKKVNHESSDYFFKDKAKGINNIKFKSTKNENAINTIDLNSSTNSSNSSVSSKN